VRRILTGGVAAICLAMLAAPAPAGASDLQPLTGLKIKASATCGSFGTNVDFVASPSEAARQAKKEQKLVFVLHVSGLFEDPKLT
jgi:hypothetical protein